MQPFIVFRDARSGNGRAGINIAGTQRGKITSMFVLVDHAIVRRAIS